MLGYSLPNDCIVISSVNNDYLRSDVIDNNSSNDINVDDGSIDNAVSNLDIASADINTFDDNASSVSDIVTDSRFREKKRAKKVLFQIQKN